MNNVFCGTLKINDYIKLQDNPVVSSFECNFIDNSGKFNASDIKVGDLVYLNTDDLSKFQIIEIIQINKSNIQFIASWNSVNIYTEFDISTECLIGRESAGLIHVQSSDISLLNRNFINKIKIAELCIDSEQSFESSTVEVSDVELTGPILGSENIYAIQDRFIPSTLEVYVNGIDQRPGQYNDYILINNNEIHFNFNLSLTESITANYIKLINIISI